MTSTPSAATTLASAFCERPTVITCGCSTSKSVSTPPPSLRASTSASCRSHASRYPQMPRSTTASSGAGVIEAVLLHQPDQVAARDLQVRRRARLVPGVPSQRIDDHAPLEALERRRQRAQVVFLRRHDEPRRVLAN